jgi:hypothetical protein
LQLPAGDRRVHADAALGDQQADGLHPGDGRRLGLLFFVDADEKRGCATRCEGDGKN